MSDSVEEEEEGYRRNDVCETCDKKCKRIRVLFSGDWKWGDGNLICQKCLNEEILEEESSMLSFKCDGRMLIYDWSWIYSWKNPHGNLKIFTEEEMQRLGGTYPNYDFELSDEDAEFIREKVLGYVRSARPGTATIESIVETSNAKKRRTKK